MFLPTAAKLLKNLGVNHKYRTIVNTFDKHCFEKFTTVEQDTGRVDVVCRIDGVRVGEKEWSQQQEAAITRDLISLGIRKS